MFVDYGQKAVHQELKAAKSVAKFFPNTTFVVFDLNAVGQTFRDLQVKSKLHVPIPHRNLPLLSLAVSLAAQEGATSIALATNLDDQSKGYASAKETFVRHFELASQDLVPNLQVRTPFVTLTKTEIIQRGYSCGLDYSITYSCMRGAEKHCGTCMQCQSRRKAFLDAGVTEPLHFYLT